MKDNSGKERVKANLVWLHEIETMLVSSCQSLPGSIILNPFVSVSALMTLIDFTLTPDDFTRQWGTPRILRG